MGFMFSRQKGGFRHGFVNAVLVFFLIYRGSFGWNIELFGLVCFCVDAIFRIEYFGGFDRLGREKMLAVFLLAGCLRVWLSYDEVCYWYRGNMGDVFGMVLTECTENFVYFPQITQISQIFIFRYYSIRSLTMSKSLYGWHRCHAAFCCIKFALKKHPWTWNSGVMFIWISRD